MSDPREPVEPQELEDVAEAEESTDAADPDANEVDADLEGTGDEPPVDGGQEDDDGANARGEARPGEVRQPSRAQRRIQALSQRTRDAEDRAARFEREAAEARRIAAERTAQESEQAEQARLSIMGPDEKFEYLRQKDRRELDVRFNRFAFQTADTNDRLTFEAECGRNPAVDAVKDEVERILQTERARGSNPTRAAIARYVIGDRALKRAPAAKTRQRNKAAVAVERERARPAGGRSDVRPERRPGANTQEARRKRLEDQII